MPPTPKPLQAIGGQKSETGMVKIRFNRRVDAGWIAEAGEIREVTQDTYDWLCSAAPGAVSLVGDPAPAAGASADPVEERRKDPPGSPPETRDRMHRRRRGVSKD